jgi:endonuclease III
MSNPCKTVECRVKMLNDMYEAIKGTELLLEQIQPEMDEYLFKPNNAREHAAFKTLIATILSVRTKDETTLKVMEKLWSVYSSPKEIAYAPIDELELLILSSGTYRQKAKRIKETSRIIHEELNDVVPSSRKELLKFPGVGQKVANCVLVISFGIPAIPVDTHVHRISNRIGWVTTKTPEKTELALEKIFPQSTWTRINYTMVSYGKRICKPIKPLCSECPVSDRCLKIILKPNKKKTTQKRTKKKK